MFQMWISRPVIQGNFSNTFFNIDEPDVSHPSSESVCNSELPWRVSYLARSNIQVKPVVHGVFTEPVWVLRGHGVVIAFGFWVEFVAFHVPARLEVI